MFNSHYIGWRASRLNGVNKYIKLGYFKDKTLLELGCGHADIGDSFYKLGAIVTSSDARKEHIEVVNQKYPHIKTLLIDCDIDYIKDKYDIILHWGLLYHLTDIEKHLENVSNTCNVLFLETEVVDAEENDFYIRTVENQSYDQSFNTFGTRPSESYVEQLLKQNGFQFKCIKDNILNSLPHIYDWDATNNEKWAHGFRRFWICWKNVESPLTV